MLRPDRHPQHESATQNRGKWALVGFIAIGAFFLLTEHRAHLFGILPYVLLLLCPLIHLFHGHGQHAHGGQRDGSALAAESAQAEIDDTTRGEP